MTCQGDAQSEATERLRGWHAARKGETYWPHASRLWRAGWQLWMEHHVGGYYDRYTQDGEPVSILDGLPRSPLARVKVSDATVRDRLEKALIDVVEQECAFELSRGDDPAAMGTTDHDYDN